MHLIITIQSSGAQRLFDHPVYQIMMAVVSGPTSHVTVKTETDSETMCSFRNNKSIGKIQRVILSVM
jgi:hypothetical protein